MFEVTSRKIYEFREFRLDPLRRLLIRNDDVVPLTHKAFETLAFLVANGGRIVEKDELLREVWPDTFVEEGSLARNISVLRKALGEGPNEHQFIQTIPRQGYRFVAPVRTFAGTDEPAVTGAEGVDREVPAELPEAGRSAAETRSGSGKKMLFAVAGGILAAFAVTAVALYFAIKAPPEAGKAMEMIRFTNSGRALDAAISPDGKYVVYVENDIGKQSIWVKQVVSGSAVRVTEPADVSYQGLAFSPDGNYVYYNVWDKKHVGAIYRVPVLGGPSTRVVIDVMPMMSVSPDDAEIAFMRSSAATGETLLLAAKTDGSGERTVARRNGSTDPGWFGVPVWSPDGSRIVFVAGGVGQEGQRFTQLAEVPASGGTERIISEKKFLDIRGLAWTGDGRGLVVTASDGSHAPFQLWQVDVGTGEARRITNDLNGYNGVSMTRDGKRMITTQGDVQSNVFVGGDAPSDEWKKVTSGRYEGIDLNWTQDGRIIYVSRESGNYDIWIMNADGTGRKRLTTDPNVDVDPAVSSDGKSILFVSLRTPVPHIFRMDMDGGDLVQLTTGAGEWGPAVSRVDDLVIYHSSTEPGLWKMKVDGSGQVRLNSKYSYMPSISPSGTHVIFNYWDADSKPEALRQAVIDLRTGRQTDLPAVPRTAIRGDSNVILKWSPDGTSYAYIDDRGGVSNLWRQRLSGGPPEQITKFNDGYIFSFDWAPDGRLAAARGTFAFDVVLISNFQ